MLPPFLEVTMHNTKLDRIFDVNTIEEGIKETYDATRAGASTVRTSLPNPNLRNSGGLAPGLSDLDGPVQEERVEGDSIEVLLAERSKTHGDYADHAAMTQALKREMRAGLNWEGLSDMQKETLEMNAHKVGRILSGDPNHADHWDDIAGYAKLISQRL